MKQPIQTHSLRTRDGMALHLYGCAANSALIQPQDTPLSAPILLVHGFNDHSGRYQREMADMACWGYTVWAYDARGHGQSDGKRGSMPHDDALIEDLASVYAWLHERYPQSPAPIVVAHSMGALCALLALFSRRIEPSALALSSPCLGVRTPWYQRLQIQWGYKIAPDWVLPQKSVDRPRTARDSEVVQKALHDPLLFQAISPRMAAFLVYGGQRLQNMVHQAAQSGQVLPVPTLMMVAGNDQIVDPKASLALAQLLHQHPTLMPQFSLQVYPEAYHELFNEPHMERQAIMQHLRNWLQTLPSA